MAATYLVENTLPSDKLLIEDLLDVSFGIDRRTKTSYRLREGNSPAVGLSLVVRDAEVGIAGSISFWPLAIGQQGIEALLLGPLVVNTRRQNLGVGLTLMHEGLLRAKRAGHTLSILVGDAPYYARVGFRKVPEGHLLLPGPVNPDRLLYLELTDGALAKANGLVLPPHRYAELSAAFAGPHKARGGKQGGKGQE
jgi:predicted N-acetyltransferase YhbS